MRSIILFTLILLTTLGACNIYSVSNTNRNDDIAKHSILRDLIDNDSDYDIENVEIYLKKKYWQIEELMDYNEQYTKKINACGCSENYKDISWSNTILLFGEDLICYKLCADGSITKHIGKWSLNSNRRTLSINFPQCNDYDARSMECVILAITNHDIVLDCKTGDKTFRALLRQTSYQSMHRQSVNIIASNIIDSCKDFNPSDIVLGLNGSWDKDSILIYDKDWEDIEDAPIFLGRHYIDGAGDSSFTFMVNGKGLEVVDIDDFEDKYKEIPIDWYYDINSSNITIIVNNTPQQFIITGYNDEYVIWDTIDSKYNVRWILKRREDTHD